MRLIRMEGKKVKIFFDDGEKVAWREGIITSEDEFCIELDNKQIISRGRMVRMELMSDD